MCLWMYLPLFASSLFAVIKKIVFSSSFSFLRLVHIMITLLATVCLAVINSQRKNPHLIPSVSHKKATFVLSFFFAVNF